MEIATRHYFENAGGRRVSPTVYGRSQGSLCCHGYNHGYGGQRLYPDGAWLIMLLNLSFYYY